MENQGTFPPSSGIRWFWAWVHLLPISADNDNTAPFQLSSNDFLPSLWTFAAAHTIILFDWMKWLTAYELSSPNTAHLFYWICPCSPILPLWNWHSSSPLPFSRFHSFYRYFALHFSQHLGLYTIFGTNAASTHFNRQMIMENLAFRWVVRVAAAMEAANNTFMNYEFACVYMTVVKRLFD